MAYVFDTSSFRILNNYFLKNFPTVWGEINRLVKEDRFISVHEVFEEAFKDNAARISNVCQHFNIDCTNVEGFMDREGWRF